MNAKKRGTRRRPITSWWDAAVQYGGYSGQRSSQSDLIQYTPHHTHTGKPLLPKMQIQFSRQGKRVNTYSDLCKPQLSVSPPANRLVLCDRVNSCSGVEARRPGRSTLPICCSDSLAVSPNSARNLMSILLPSVCTALPFDSRLWKTFSELSPQKNTLLHLPNTYSDFRL